jgi:hypothetical protein
MAKKKIPQLKRKRRSDIEPDSLTAALNWHRLGQVMVAQELERDADQVEAVDTQRDSKGSEG